MIEINVRAGTMDDALALGYVLHHPNPNPIEGICLAEQFIGDCAQEAWECESDARQRKIYTALGATGGLAAGLLVCLAGHIPAAAAIVPALLGTGIGWRSAQGQNRADEIMGHAVSARASMRYEGMTLERAQQCFRDNLQGYDTCAGLSIAELDKLWTADFPAADKWLDANQELIARLVAIKAANP